MVFKANLISTFAVIMVGLNLTAASLSSGPGDEKETPTLTKMKPLTQLAARAALAPLHTPYLDNSENHKFGLRKNTKLFLFIKNTFSKLPLEIYSILIREMEPEELGRITRYVIASTKTDNDTVLNELYDEIFNYVNEFNTDFKLLTNKTNILAAHPLLGEKPIDLTELRRTLNITASTIRDLPPLDLGDITQRLISSLSAKTTTKKSTALIGIRDTVFKYLEESKHHRGYPSCFFDLFLYKNKIWANHPLLGNKNIDIYRLNFTGPLNGIKLQCRLNCHTIPLHPTKMQKEVIASLRTLPISHLWLINAEPQDMEILFASGWENLTHLTFSKVKLSQGHFKHFHKTPPLPITHLDISETDGNAYLTEINRSNRLPCLTSLSLARKDLSDTDVKTIARSPRFGNLRILDLEGNPKITIGGRVFLNQSQNLKDCAFIFD